MATPAAPARLTTSSSSTSVNTSAECLSVRYRLPKTSPRTLIGTPRNDLIGGWLGREPEAVRVLGQVRQPQRTGVDDQQAQDAVALGRMSDGPAPFVVDADRDELRQSSTFGVEDTERAVAGVDELTAAAVMRRRMAGRSRSEATVCTASRSWRRLRGPANEATSDTLDLDPIGARSSVSRHSVAARRIVARSPPHASWPTTWKRRPVMATGWMRMKRCLRPACQGNSGRSKASK